VSGHRSWPGGEDRSRATFSRREAKGEGVWGAVCFSRGPLPFIGPRREGEAVVQRPGDKAARWWSGRSVGARSSAGDEERRAGAEFFGGPRGGFYWGRGGGERPGEAEKRLEMVGSFNGFGRFGIEGGSGEDGAGHCFEKRTASGAVDSAYMGTEESAGGIGAAATPTKGGSGCSQWWGATSSRGGRSPGGRVGHLGRTELAGRLGPAGKPRPGRWG
jgi:hypothetical protein